MDKILLTLQNYDYWELLRETLFCMFTSFAFIIALLYILSPKIKISPFISEQVDPLTGQKYYIFKVVNLSWFNAYNGRFQLSKRVPYIVQGTQVNHRLVDVPLMKSDVFRIPSYKRGNFGDYALLLRTDTDISVDIATVNLDYELSVSVCHGLSNLTKVVVMRFKKASDIYTDSFEFGKSLDIDN